jgi:hypothetical protein
LPASCTPRSPFRPAGSPAGRKNALPGTSKPPAPLSTHPPQGDKP